MLEEGSFLPFNLLNMSNLSKEVQCQIFRKDMRQLHVYLYPTYELTQKNRFHVTNAIPISDYKERVINNCWLFMKALSLSTVFMNCKINGSLSGGARSKSRSQGIFNAFLRVPDKAVSNRGGWEGWKACQDFLRL